MRRTPANLVLMILLWSYLAPLLLVATELDLPACCRGRGGKHHCTCCMGRPGGDAAPGFHGQSPQCPCRLLGPAINGTEVAQVKKFFSIELPAAPLLAQAEPLSRPSSRRIRNSGRSPPPRSSNRIQET